MKFEIKIIIGIVLIFLTINCVNAEDNTNYSYNITEDTYLTYFNDNGTLKEDIESGSILNIGQLKDKQLIINTPVNITNLGEYSLENTSIILLDASKGSNIRNLNFKNTISSPIINYASDITIINNLFQITGECLNAIYSKDNINTEISNNIILFNKTNTLIGISIKDSNKTNIKNNKIEGENTNLTVAILIDSGINNTINANNIKLTSQTIAIEAYRQENTRILNNTINTTSEKIIGILLEEVNNSIIIENEIESNNTDTNESYGIFNQGENNLLTRNIIEGQNLNGIITISNNTDIIFNLISLSSNKTLDKITAITATSSNNQINENVIIFLEDNTNATYGIHIFKENEDLTNNTIKLNQIYIDSLSMEISGIYVNDLNNCEIDSNIVFLQSEGMIYGFSSKPIKEEETTNYKISDNIILAKGNDIRLIEIISANNYTIENNNLTAEGECAYGIVAENITNTTIKNNTINVIGKNTSNAKGNDIIKPGNSPITIKGDSKKDTIANNTLIGNTNITIENTTKEIIIENNTKEINTKIEANNTIIIENTGSYFKGKILTEDGKAVIGQHLNINLTRLSNGLSRVYNLVSDYNGEFSIQINLASGNYSAKLFYDGLKTEKETYNSCSSDTLSIKVVKEYDNRTETVINAKDLIKTYNSDVNFTGTFKDINGGNIIGHHLKVKLTRLSSMASKTYDVVTDYTGTFSIPINLAIGLYTAEVYYEGTVQYQKTSTNIINIRVSP